MTTPFTLPSCTPPRAYTPSPCSCQRCKKDNQCPKLFSSDNNMYPGSVPAELQGLSQTEEMLIARSCPIMRVIHLKGGQLGSDARPNQLQQKSPTGSLAPAVPVAITPTFSPWTHTSDDSYIYQLSLVLATATVFLSSFFFSFVVLRVPPPCSFFVRFVLSSCRFPFVTCIAFFALLFASLLSLVSDSVKSVLSSRRCPRAPCEPEVCVFSVRATSISCLAFLMLFSSSPIRFRFGHCFILSFSCLLYTSTSPRDQRGSRMPSSA